MANSTFISAPLDVTDGPTLRRFLETLIQQLDVAFGNRGNSAFTSQKDFNTAIDSVADTLNRLISEDKTFVKLDGSRVISAPLSYNNFNASADYDLANIKWITDKQYTSNPIQSTLAERSMPGIVRSATYDQVEAQSVADAVKANADKIDELINTLKLANIIS